MNLQDDFNNLVHSRLDLRCVPEIERLRSVLNEIACDYNINEYGDGEPITPGHQRCVLLADDAFRSCPDLTLERNTWLAAAEAFRLKLVSITNPSRRRPTQVYIDNRWPSTEIEPQYIDAISASRGWNPLGVDGMMTVTIHGNKYEIKRIS